MTTYSTAQNGTLALVDPTAAILIPVNRTYVQEANSSAETREASAGHA